MRLGLGFNSINNRFVPKLGTVLTYVSDGDTNGVFHYIGTNENKSPWTNPYVAGFVDVTMSSVYADDPSFGDVKTSVDRQKTVNLCTHPRINSFFIFDLKEYRLQPTAYSMRSRDGNNNLAKGWKIEGSNDNSNWTHLYEISDNPLARDSWFSDSINSAQYYRYFKLTQTQPDSNDRNTFCLGEFELYGMLIKD